MGLFQLIFGKKPPEPAREVSQWQTLTGYTPAFTTWGGQLYESELIRAAVDTIARAVAKLEVTVQGTAKPKLRAAVRTGPNPWQTWPQFLYRLATILYVRNTAFIIPLRDEMDQVTGYTTAIPTRVEMVGDTLGRPWVRFHFASGETAAELLSAVGIVNRFQFQDDYFGESNRALDPTLNLITMQQQGIPEAMKNAATFRFMARLTNFQKPEDLRKERDRFNREQLATGSGGLLLFPSTYGDIKQIEPRPYTIDAEQMKLIQTSVYNYFGVNEDVLQNKAIGDAWSAFYEGCVEWVAIQASETMSRMTFSDRERGGGSGIFLTSNRLQYMTNKDKLNVSAQMADRGLMRVNEIRAIWNLPPLPPEIGDRLPVRGEYYDAANPPEGKTSGGAGAADRPGQTGRPGSGPADEEGDEDERDEDA